MGVVVVRRGRLAWSGVVVKRGQAWSSSVVVWCGRDEMKFFSFII
jgi:hypothetical protein